MQVENESPQICVTTGTLFMEAHLSEKWILEASHCNFILGAEKGDSYRDWLAVN
jgi:hypothetical protein